MEIRDQQLETIATQLRPQDKHGTSHSETFAEVRFFKATADDQWSLLENELVTRMVNDVQRLQFCQSRKAQIWLFLLDTNLSHAAHWYILWT